MKVPHSCKRDDWKGVPPLPNDPYLLNKKIAIVGYSVRSLNYVAQYAGLNTLAIDCFADMDLRRLADEFIYVNLEEQRNNEGKLEFSAAQYMAQVLKSHNKRINECDYLIAGSSFENDIDAWKKVASYANYVGNNPTNGFRVRELKQLYPYLSKRSIQYPLSIIFKEKNDGYEYVVYNPSDFVEDRKKIYVSGEITDFFDNQSDWLSFPCILKSEKSGGGFGVYLINDEKELIETYQNLKKIRSPPYILQEFIDGTPMSCSIIANGIQAKLHTISKQIIGELRFGCKGNFTYCGNIMSEEISNPNHKDNSELSSELNKIAEIVTKFAQLQGSNGIDFVLSGDQVYFMEVNPRFQGTIDLVLASTGENLIQKHLKSIEKGDLPNDACFPDSKVYMKVIYFSPIDFHVLVDLQGLEFRDVPLIGSFIPNGAPLCSNIIIEESVDLAFEKALDDRDLMIRVLGLHSRLNENGNFLKR